MSDSSDDIMAEVRANVDAAIKNSGADEAERILTKGNPYQYFLNTFSLDHVGDLAAARVMTHVFAASAIANGEGLHTYLSGNSGKGKSHAAETMFKQLPKQYRYDRSFSDKYLYYKGKDAKLELSGGIVVMIDDQSMSPGIQELFKVAVSHYRNGTQYGTVLQQKSVELEVPARISWVLLKVDDPGDDQVMNRLMQPRIDEGEEKIRDSSEMIKGKYDNLREKTVIKDRYEVRVCQQMWGAIKAEPVAVQIPGSRFVNFAEYDNLRNHEIFFNLLMAHTVMFREQRMVVGETEDGVPIIEAVKEDYKEAKYIFDGLYEFGGQHHNTVKNEDMIIESVLRLNPDDGIFTLKDVVKESKLSYTQCYRAFHGRKVDGVVLGGLLSKCRFISVYGRRTEHEKEVETNYSPKGEYAGREVTKNRSFNEDVFFVDVGLLRAWKNNGAAVDIDSAVNWEN